MGNREQVESGGSAVRQLRNQAKDLLRAHRAGEPNAIRRIGESHPRFSGSSQAEIAAAEIVLADAQLDWSSSAASIYEFRAELMVRNNEGLTKTYNRFHDLYEKSADILKLRELHDAMDRAVLDAYGWTDIRPTCEFLLEYEEEEDEDDPGAKKSKRKKPWRYRWPDEIRDEVLARLLDLSQKRAEEERLAGVTANAAEKKKAKGKGRGRKKKSDPNQQKMFGEGQS